MKKLLSVLLAVTMLLSMSVGAVAADLVMAPGPVAVNTVVTTGIKGIRSDFMDVLDSTLASGYATVTSTSDSDLSISSIDDLDDMEIAPGDIIQIPFTADMFTYADGASRSDKSFVSTSALRSANVTIKTTVSSGSGTLAFSIGGNKNKAYIKIEANNSPAYDGQKFSYAMYLSYRGVRKADTRIRVRGVMEAPQIEVDNSDDYVDISDGQTVKALTSVRGIEIYIGEYCTIKRNLVKGGEYSGVALTDVLVSDEKYFDKYTDLEYIYRLETVRLKATGKIVNFDLDEKMYVYNTKGEYIGTTNESLPYWTKYFISSRKYDKIAL